MTNAKLTGHHLGMYSTGIKFFSYLAAPLEVKHDI